MTSTETTRPTLTESVQQARWEMAVEAGLSSSDAALYAEGLIDLPGLPLAAVREPLDYDKGYDVIDTRTGEELAWRGSRIAEEAFASCQEIAEKLNEEYPDRSMAPAHDSLVHEIVGWRIAGIAG